MALFGGGGGNPVASILSGVANNPTRFPESMGGGREDDQLFQNDINALISSINQNNDNFFNSDFLNNTVNTGGEQDALQALISRLPGATNSAVGSSNRLAGSVASDRALALDRFGNIENEYANIYNGNDSRFGAFKDAQFGQLDSNKQSQVERLKQDFARRGLGGSAAERQALQNIENSIGQQKLNLGGQLGLQEMSRQDQALGNANALNINRANISSSLLNNEGNFNNTAFNQNMAGSQFGSSLIQQLLSTRLSGQDSFNTARQLENQSITSGIENLAIAPSLRIALLAAENAGKTDDTAPEKGFLGGPLDDTIGGLF